MRSLILFSIILVISISSQEHTIKKQNPKKKIEELTKQYFEYWSNGKMEEYGNLFYPTAVVYYKDRFTNSISLQTLEIFLKEQTQIQLNPQRRMKEVPLSIQIELVGEETALVNVYWKLSSNHKAIFGYDHFIWTKTDRDWKILSLFFYNVN